MDPQYFPADPLPLLDLRLRKLASFPGNKLGNADPDFLCPGKTKDTDSHTHLQGCPRDSQFP